jgi:hypothetical protein
MSLPVPPSTDNAPGGATPPPALSRGLTLAALAVLLVFIVSQGALLFREWLKLRSELNKVRTTAVIGYPGITPHYSYARRPSNWFHDEGESTLLWAGWRHGIGHTWFRVGRGDVNRDRITEPVGRDVFRAIDHPVVERGGGTLWARIPDEAPVVGHRLAGVDTAYPILVLQKVLAVNDVVGEHPFLVLNFPFEPRCEEQIAVYEPVVEGERLTMGLAGYFHDGKPVLYDRGTESLWVGEPDALLAIGGSYKGQRLRQVARPAPMPWGSWRSQHPGSRLVVGDGRPEEQTAL